MISVNEALDIILENTERLKTAEVDLLDAYGMVLAKDIISQTDIPPFTKSAMDGYAVRSKDLIKSPVTLTMVDSLTAGGKPNMGIRSGECTKIMTGAQLPEGADAVVMLEDTERKQEGKVSINITVKPGKNVCHQGEDVKKGDRVIKEGTLIKEPEIAVLASQGQHRVRVTRKPEVCILSTGNEILEPDRPLEAGKIHNSNGPMLFSLVRATECRVKYLGIADDDRERLEEMIIKGFEYDCLLISGGVSKGDFDLVPPVLEKVGANILFHWVAVKPGKPLLFAKKGKSIIFGIPGNPVSNLTTFYMFIKPAITKMMGRDDYSWNFIDGYITCDLEEQGERVHIIPSKYRVEEGKIQVSPLKIHGSGDITGCLGCECFTVIGLRSKSFKKGDMVPVILKE